MMTDETKVPGLVLRWTPFEEPGREALGTCTGDRFVLRKPLMEAATQEFHIDGSWLEPKIQRVDNKAAARGKDDAAGVAITARMTSQIRGLNQAARNANDGVSLLQTGEGAMAAITSSLQRARELAVQAANATNSASDRGALANEMRQLMAEVDRVSGTTQFNGERIFDQSQTSIRGDANQAAVRDSLRLGWLEEPESLIRQYFGLQGDGAVALAAAQLNLTQILGRTHHQEAARRRRHLQ